LDSLTSIGEDVFIHNNDILTDLAGLDEVSVIGGGIRVSYNDNMHSLSGLDNVGSIGGDLSVYKNDMLQDIFGIGSIDAGTIDNLFIYDNPLLSQCAVTSICDYLAAPNGTIEVHDNAPGCYSPEEIIEDCVNDCLPYGITFTTQEEINNFQTNYPGCTEIEGDVEICGTDITKLNGLIVLTSIGGSLNIHDNPMLGCLTGLVNIDPASVNNLHIYNNSSLSNCDVQNICDYLISPTGIIDIHDNAEGCNSQLEVQAACETHCLPDGIIFSTQEEIDNFQNNHPDCGTIEGYVMISGDDIFNLDGLSVLSAIGGYLKIWANPALTEFNGLSNLTSIGGYLKFYANNSLTDISGLEALTSIYGYFYIASNDVITSLTGLENIEAGSIEELTIRFNDSLSSCHAHSICDYLTSANPILKIYGNAPGCNSPGEVVEACNYLPPPENLTLQITGSDVILGWEAPASEDVLGYNVYRDGLLIEEGSPDLSYTDPGLPDGSYWYAVTALYPEGESVICDPVQAAIGGFIGKLQGFVRDAISHSSIENAWVSAQDSDYGAVTYTTPFGSHYTLSLPGGTYNISCEAFGYQKQTLNDFQIIDGDTKHHTFYLNPENSIFVEMDREENVHSTGIYPNPFQSSVTITYSLQQDSYVWMEIQKANGQELVTLVDEFQEKGVYQVVLDGSELEPGVYFCVLKTGDGIETVKIIKL